MASPEETQTLNEFLLSVKTSLGISEEQSLAVYRQAQQFPTLKEAFSPFEQQLANALLHHKADVLDAILQKTFLTVQNTIQTLPAQVQPTIEKEGPVQTVDNEDPKEWSRRAIHAIDEGKETVAKTDASKLTKNREFIKKSVEQFSKRNGQITPEQQEQITEKITQIKTGDQDISSTDAVRQAVREILPEHAEIAQKLASDTGIRAAVDTYVPVDLAVATGVLRSSNPDIFIQSFRRDVEVVPTTKPGTVSVVDALTKAQVLSSSFAVFKTNPQDIDYTDFFKNIGRSGSSSVAQALAPAADLIFNKFPRGVQEAVAFRVMEASWNRQIRDPSFLQKTLGAAFQSPSVSQAIQNGNRMFASQRQSAAILSRSQVFFSDVFVTVFRVNISQEYLQLSALNSSLRPTNPGHMYLSLLASQGGDLLAKAAMKKTANTVAKEAGKKAATTAIGKSLGAFFGSFLGPGVGTAIGYFLGDLIIDKALSFVVEGAKKLFSFISFDWLGKIASGTYEPGPILKDSSFILALIFILPIFFFSGLLSFIPSIDQIFPFFQNAQSYQKQVDNAMVSGIGGAAGKGADCIKNPTNPICLATPCDTTKQDCRWPTSGYITQGPHTTCSAHATHYSANAIDIATSIGTPVYATINGTVRSPVITSCPDNTQPMKDHCNGGYGNSVVIDAADKSFSLRFGHLLGSSVIVKAGQTVSPTTVIGFVDQSGYSSGPHLHFEMLNSSTNINSILPFSVAACVGTSGYVDACPPCSYPRVGGGQ